MSNVDILAIDAEIKNFFNNEYEKLPVIEENLKDLITALENENLPIKVKNNIKKAKKTCEEQIDKLKARNEYNFYIANTLPLLERYKKKLNEPIVVSFIGKPKTNNVEKEEIVKEYLEISDKYMNIKNKNIETKPSKNNITCNNCANKSNFDIYEGTIYICRECFSQQNILSHTSSYNDIDRVNISTKYMYDRRIHFRDCIKQYQGKQNSTIPQKIYDDLKREFDMHHLLDHKSKNIYKNITKNQILLFLKELGYANHYENVHLIHYNFTKIKPDDISHLEDQLMDDFDALTALYDVIYKGINRKNFINTQYVLYQLLQRHKHKCDKSEFVILKTVDRKFFHDEVCKTLFEILGWNHKPSY
jgi:Zn finger protein HypA/HybF involved in hydrogenase expression